MRRESSSHWLSSSPPVLKSFACTDGTVRAVVNRPCVFTVSISLLEPGRSLSIPRQRAAGGLVPVASEYTLPNVAVHTITGRAQARAQSAGRECVRRKSMPSASPWPSVHASRVRAAGAYKAALYLRDSGAPPEQAGRSPTTELEAQELKERFSEVPLGREPWTPRGGHVAHVSDRDHSVTDARSCSCTSSVVLGDADEEQQTSAKEPAGVGSAVVAHSALTVPCGSGRDAGRLVGLSTVQSIGSSISCQVQDDSVSHDPDNSPTPPPEQTCDCPQDNGMLTSSSQPTTPRPSLADPVSSLGSPATPVRPSRPPKSPGGHRKVLDRPATTGDQLSRPSSRRGSTNRCSLVRPSQKSQRTPPVSRTNSVDGKQTPTQRARQVRSVRSQQRLKPGETSPVRARQPPSSVAVEPSDGKETQSSAALRPRNLSSLRRAVKCDLKTDVDGQADDTESVASSSTRVPSLSREVIDTPVQFQRPPAMPPLSKGSSRGGGGVTAKSQTAKMLRNPFRYAPLAPGRR